MTLLWWPIQLTGCHNLFVQNRIWSLCTVVMNHVVQNGNKLRLLNSLLVKKAHLAAWFFLNFFSTYFFFLHVSFPEAGGVVPIFAFQTQAVYKLFSVGNQWGHELGACPGWHLKCFLHSGKLQFCWDSPSGNLELCDDAEKTIKQLLSVAYKDYICWDRFTIENPFFFILNF